MLKYFLGLILLFTCASAFSPRPLLGTKECAWGPSFWCKNITNAKNCNAVKHCIQTVWEHQKPVEDNDDICGICKAMVKDARDQLESNETLDMIKDVFQRSCKLIVFKPIVKECVKFADEYAEELVDMLGSYMSPDVICTLAGLCNSAKIDKLYDDVAVKNARDKERTAELQKDCESCMDFADFIGKQIEKATPYNVKSYFYGRCRSLGSLSDACYQLFDEYEKVIYDKVKKDFSPSSICYFTSSCVNGYSRKIQVKTESDVGVISINNDAISKAVKHLSDDQTCALCKTLIKHLKDVLVSNTTEIEFRHMLKGICEQTGKFRSECLSLVDEYYEKIYNFIINDLDGNQVCRFAGICLNTVNEYWYYNGPIAPLLPAAPVPVKETKIGSVSVAKSDSGVRVFTPISPTPVKVEISFGDPLESKFQLPIERMAVPHAHDLNVNNRESCIFCQYLLHYIQKVISQPYGENYVKKAVDKVCDELPHSITLQCRNFVEEFGDAFVAILAQEIDPSQVCPALHICPARILKDKYEQIEIGGAPGCPLCLMVVEDITEKLKDNKTEDAIRTALHKLCERMPKNLEPQCNEFVQKYTEEVVDMMLADFTPQEVCTFLKLCHSNADVELVAPYPKEKHEILTNEVPKGDVEEIKEKTPPLCFLCEFLMDKIKYELENNETDQDIQDTVTSVCDHIPTDIHSDCLDFVKSYSKYIVEMLENNVDPGMVCQEMHMCKEQPQPVHLDHVYHAVQECAVCEALVGAIRGLLEDKSFDRNMSRYASQICYSVPFLEPRQMDMCRSMVLSYGPSIINLLVELGVRPELVCSRLQLCDERERTKVELIETTSKAPAPHSATTSDLLAVENERCLLGPDYWCKDVEKAKECGTLVHCRVLVWYGDNPPTNP